MAMSAIPILISVSVICYQAKACTANKKPLLQLHLHVGSFTRRHSRTNCNTYPVQISMMIFTNSNRRFQISPNSNRRFQIECIIAHVVLPSTLEAGLFMLSNFPCKPVHFRYNCVAKIYCHVL